jgi:hypothetical protein
VFGAGVRMHYDDVGILGLSFKTPGEHGTSIFEEAVSLKKCIKIEFYQIRQGILDKPIFTAFFRKCHSKNCNNGGLITLGGKIQVDYRLFLMFYRCGH